MREPLNANAPKSCDSKESPLPRLPRDLSAPPRRSVILIAGSGRSGTSVLAGVLKLLGGYVPQPELEANSMNPRGFNESQWVVDFHNGLLREAGIHISDGRPEAAEEARRVAQTTEGAAELESWLAEQLEISHELVVKDPRITWFIDLWDRVATSLAAAPAFVTMLRPPVEVAGSKLAVDGSRDLVDFVAVWTNLMLCTERSTRGRRRAFVSYHDLLNGWRHPVGRLGTQLGLERLAPPDPQRAADVDRFVTPSLHRTHVSWDDVELPIWLREVAAELWDNLESLASGAAESPDVHSTFDRLAGDYEHHYRLAESVVMSTRSAIERDMKRARIEATQQKRNIERVRADRDRIKAELQKARSQLERARAAASGDVPTSG